MVTYVSCLQMVKSSTNVKHHIFGVGVLEGPSYGIISGKLGQENFVRIINANDRTEALNPGIFIVSS